MKSFSERYGYTQPKQIQRESMDEDLRNSLWNMFIKEFQYELENFTDLTWRVFLKKPADELPKTGNWTSNKHIDVKLLKKILLDYEWYKVLDFLQFINKALDRYERERFTRFCNAIFKLECSAYRFVNNLIIEITSEEEIKEIETAIDSPIEEIKEHIKLALGHLSRREKPDYRNSIKESISAVECAYRKITGENTLGKALNKLESKGIELNAQFKDGLEKIYAYTCGEEGIRHAIMDKTDIEPEDARFMLIICSSFVNYIIEKAQKAGLL